MAATTQDASSRRGNLAQRHPVVTYFALTFTVSWLGALCVVLPALLRHEAVPKMAGLMMFPAMLVGPSFVGILLTRIVDGKEGLHDLFARMRRVNFSARWYAALLIPPVFVTGVLFCLRTFVSPVYAPNRFFVGISFGLAAGFFEEIGWMGYAFPKMRAKQGAASASIVLGLLWAAWHLPVIDYLGTATPHGVYWWPFFLSFAAAMTAMRVLIAWLYTGTRSVLLAQLMHASSTGALVAFSPAGVSGAQEAFWYAVYAGALWVAVMILIARGQLARRRS